MAQNTTTTETTTIPTTPTTAETTSKTTTTKKHYYAEHRRYGYDVITYAALHRFDTKAARDAFIEDDYTRRIDVTAQKARAHYPAAFRPSEYDAETNPGAGFWATEEDGHDFWTLCHA